MLIHYSQIPKAIWPWVYFTPKELSCRCCGEFYFSHIAYEAINMLSAARSMSGKPFIMNSAHRCGIHNARIGGAPLSEHKRIAIDISTHGHDRHELKDLLAEAGFTTFGLYQTFIHTDPRPGRLWYGKGAIELWNG